MKNKIVIMILFFIVVITSINRSYAKLFNEKTIDLANIEIERQYIFKIKYIDKYNNKLLKEKTEILNKGSTYNSEVLEFTNYIYEDKNKESSGVINEDTEIIYYYAKKGIYSKLYDTNKDNKGDTLLINNVPAFSYDNGKLVKDYENKDCTNQNKINWYDDRSNIEKVIVLNEIQPNKTADWFFECINLKTIEGLEKIDTQKVKNMSNMFAECKQLHSLNLKTFNTKNVTDMSHMFEKCEQLKSLDLNNWDTSNVTAMTYMFSNCVNLENLNISNFNTQNVLSMGYMFYNCKKLKKIGIDKFNTEKVQSIVYMFYNCESIDSLNVFNWKTGQIETMQGVFKYCSNLKSLDLTNWNTNKVTEMNYMFSNCTSLEKIYVSNSFKIDKVKLSKEMFWQCTSIKGKKGTTYNSEKTDIEYARIDTIEKPGYFDSK